ncbi:MAG TPA: response regulator transcription factor, partial [Acidimicrobiales bacterium]|nr:response regulator transcription factor [Acidimicrobiales bacterium]
LEPDVVLMDLRMPNLDGVSATERIRARQPQTQVLVLTTYDTDSDILRAIDAGAVGCLLKDAPRDELFRAVRAAARGESVLAPAVLARLMTRMRAPAAEALSAREVEVLSLVARGAANKEVARTLFMRDHGEDPPLPHLHQAGGRRPDRRGHRRPGPGHPQDAGLTVLAQEPAGR